MSSITTSAIETPSRRSVEGTCDDLAILVLVVVGLVASLTFRDYGLGWDDYTHAEYADLLLRMYGSGFKDTAALSPSFYGHMFMNPKDAPFAVAMICLMMGLCRFAEEYPQPSPRTILNIGLGAGFSIGSRILGGLALVYALIGFVPLFMEEIRTQGNREAIRRFAHVLYMLLPGLVLGYLVMGLIWPWSIIEPGNPFLALTYFSHFFERPWKEMFDGALVSVPDMPWSYLPTLFALQLPGVLLALLFAGIVGTFVVLPRRDVTARRKTILLMLMLAAALPIAIAMGKRPALYND